MVGVRDIEGLTAITNVEGGVSAFDMEDALSEGRAMVIGAREGVLMLRAHDAAQYKVNAPHLMISGEKSASRRDASRLEDCCVGTSLAPVLVTHCGVTSR